MHQRAISFIVSKASPATSQATVFSLALQAAAARAWSRQVSTHGPSTSGVRSKKHHTGPVLPRVTRDDLSTPSASCKYVLSSHSFVCPVLSQPSATSRPAAWLQTLPLVERVQPFVSLKIQIYGYILPSLMAASPHPTLQAKLPFPKRAIEGMGPHPIEWTLQPTPMPMLR